jgi:hypothetical protein
VFATTAQSTIANSTPQPGNPAIPVLVDRSDSTVSQRNGNAYTIDLGTLPVGDMPNINFAIANIASAPADNLTGGFTVTNGGGVQFTGATTFPAIAPGQLYSGLSALVDSGDLGANSETLTFTPDDLNASGFGATLPNITLTIQYAVALPGTATVNSPRVVDFGIVRAGTTQSQAVSVTNSAITGSSPLDASSTVAGAATSSGAIRMLAAGATDDTGLRVGLDTTKGGKESGVATINSTADSGGNTEFMSSQAVEVLGSVYREAAASIPALIAHPGDPGTRSLTITNSDLADGFSENPIASVAGTTGSANATGSTTGEIAPGATNSAVSVAFPTNAVGTNGTVTIDPVTDGTGIDGFGTADLGQVALPVTIDNFAQASIQQLAGPGTLTRSGDAFSLDLGSIPRNTGFLAARFGVVNSASGPADLLSGSFVAPTSGAFTMSGFSAFSGLAAGGNADAMTRQRAGRDRDQARHRSFRRLYLRFWAGGWLSPFRWFRRRRKTGRLRRIPAPRRRFPPAFQDAPESLPSWDRCAGHRSSHPARCHAKVRRRPRSRR